MTVLEARENDQLDILDADAPPEADVSEKVAESPRDLPEEAKQERRDAKAELQQKADGGLETHKFEAPRDELARFNPERAGLRATSPDSVAQYIAEHRASHPWLAVAEKACPEAQRIFVALDSGSGHGHIRHEGWVTEDANRRRVLYLQDPAQADPVKRDLSVDGLKSNGKRHACGEIATRITDPDAFATAFVRGTNHPKVRGALDKLFDPADDPAAVSVPISDLLGRQGHRYCSGWKLEPVDGSMDKARDNRKEWVKAKVGGKVPDRPEPEAKPVRTFEDGVVTFLVVGNKTERRYEILTMYVDPPENDERGV